MLELFRRHQKSCSHAGSGERRGRNWKRCKCPVWVDGTLFGGDYRRSLQTNVWEVAEGRKRELEESGQVALLAKIKKVKEATKVYIENLEGRRVSTETIRKHKNYLTPLETFCERIGKDYLRQITFEDLVAFRGSWNDGPLSSKKKLERLRGFWSFCNKAGWINNQFAKALDMPIVRQCPTLPFTTEQMAAIFDACEIYPDNYGNIGADYAVRLKTMTMLLRYTGMRIRDAVQLTTNKVSSAVIFLYQQKTGEPVTIPIPEVLAAALEALPGRSHPSFFFWSGNGNVKSCVGDWQRSYRKLFRFAGITHRPDPAVGPNDWPRRLTPEGKPVRAHPHMFRDTFAVEKLLSGMAIEDLSVLLGHTSIKTTQTHYAPWVKARRDRLEAEVRRVWRDDPILESLNSTLKAQTTKPSDNKRKKGKDLGVVEAAGVGDTPPPKNGIHKACVVFIDSAGSTEKAKAADVGYMARYAA